MKVKNSYENIEDRVSFAIMASICDKEYDDSCGDSTQVDKVLSMFYFTVFYIDESIDFSTEELVHGHGRPIRT